MDSPSPCLRPVSILGSDKDVVRDLKFRAEAAPRSQRLNYSLVHALPFLRQFSLKEGDLLAVCVDAAAGLVLSFETESHSCPVIRSAQGKVPVEGRDVSWSKLGAQIHPSQNQGTVAVLGQPSLNGPGRCAGRSVEVCRRYAMTSRLVYNCLS